jgi:hypothetical protein
MIKDRKIMLKIKIPFEAVRKIWKRAKERLKQG